MVQLFRYQVDTLCIYKNCHIKAICHLTNWIDDLGLKLFKQQ